MARDMKQRIESNLSNVIYAQSGRLNGIYRGYIIDRQDKYGVGRVKVHIPELQRKTMPETKTVEDGYCDTAYEMEAIWVMPRRLQTLVHSVPWLNQWVEIRFEDGDPSRGYYSNAIIHIDEPMYHLKVDGGSGHKPPMTCGENYKCYPRSSAEDSGEDITIANEEYRNDTKKLMYVSAACGGCKKIKEVTSKPHIELIADSHNSSTPRMGHYDVRVDNLDMTYTERRTGQKRTIVQHDTMHYMYLRNPEGDGLIMHHGKESDNNYVELTTAKANILHMNDDLQQLYLTTKGNGSIACSDIEQELYIGYGLKYEDAKHDLTTLGKNRKYDAWYSKRKKKVATDITSTQYDQNGGMGTSNITKQTCIIRGPANIYMDEPTGFIFLNSF